MKRFLYKLLKNNKGMYDFVFEEILKERKLEAIQKVIGDKKVFYQNDLKDKEVVNISDSILFYTNIRDCKISGNITNNIMQEANISNNLFLPKELETEITTKTNVIEGEITEGIQIS